MTRTTNARIAGFTFLFYIGIGITGMFLNNRATNAQGAAAKLARIAEHASDVRAGVLLTLLECFSALVLAVTLYGITRDEDHELAMLAMTCRVGEGILGAMGIPEALRRLWLATAGAGEGGPDAATASALGAVLFMPGANVPTGAIFFAVGSMLFSYLMLRGRIIPAALAWLGVFASVVLVLGLPMQMVGFIRGPVTWYLWMPALVFELTLGPWLMIKGVSMTQRGQARRV
jgi:hypothetical protein